MAPLDANELVECILRAQHPREVFDDLLVGAPDEQVCKYFKEISRVVHPDKCQHPRTVEAFQKLQQLTEFAKANMKEAIPAACAASGDASDSGSESGHGEAWHWEDHGSEREDHRSEREDRPFGLQREPIPDWQEVSTYHDNGGEWGFSSRGYSEYGVVTSSDLGFMSKNAHAILTERTEGEVAFEEARRREEQRRHERHLLQRLEGLHEKDEAARAAHASYLQGKEEAVARRQSAS